jgi:serine/threonine protein kinase
MPPKRHQLHDAIRAIASVNNQSPEWVRKTLKRLHPNVKSLSNAQLCRASETCSQVGGEPMDTSDDLPPLNSPLNIKHQIIGLHDYTLGKLLGKGTFGTVNLAVDKATGKTVAIKRINKSMANPDEFQLELETLQSIQSQCYNYLLCYEANFEDDKHYYLVTEFLDGFMELAEYIRYVHEVKIGKVADHITSKQLGQIILNIIKGVQQLHSLGIGHRDLKPGNILVNPKTLKIKIIDFGLVCGHKKCEKSYPYVHATPIYSAPEALKRMGKYNISDIMNGDVFATGLIIWELLNAGNVFRTNLWMNSIDFEMQKSITDMAKSTNMPIGLIIQENFNFPDQLIQSDYDVINRWKGIKHDIPELQKYSLTRMLERDPNKRGFMGI